MNEAFGTVVALMLSIYLMFLAPLQCMMYENEKVERLYITNEITFFVEQVRNTGKISKDMYSALMEKVSSLNNLYTLEITHYKNIFNEDKSQVLYFEEKEFTEEIKKEIETGGYYKMGRNEYIKVMVTEDEKIVSVYGGSIKNETD